MDSKSIKVLNELSQNLDFLKIIDYTCIDNQLIFEKLGIKNLISDNVVSKKVITEEAIFNNITLQNVLANLIEAQNIVGDKITSHKNCTNIIEVAEAIITSENVDMSKINLLECLKANIENGTFMKLFSTNINSHNLISTNINTTDINIKSGCADDFKIKKANN